MAVEMMLDWEIQNFISAEGTGMQVRSTNDIGQNSLSALAAETRHDTRAKPESAGELIPTTSEQR